jgi:hypothetical protein
MGRGILKNGKRKMEDGKIRKIFCQVQDFLFLLELGFPIFHSG